MGFLSRKSRPEQEPQAEGVPAPDPVPESVDQAPDEGGEIKISKAESNGVSSTDAEQGGHHPAAPGREAEEAAGIEVDAPSDAGAPAEPEAASETADEGPMRLRADELITPSRHAGSGDEAEEAKGAKVISFANQKGGVAKTTTTLNLAVAFSESGHRVLCIDLDPQGNLTMSQGIDPDKVEKSMYDVLVHDMPITDVIQEREIDIAVASIDLAGAEIAMSTKIGRERSLEKALKPVRGDYDFVCIDTPPSLGLLTINALTASDKVIVPVQCEYLSMRGLVQLQNTLKMIQENLNPGVTIEGILPTMLDSRTVHAKEAVEILEENFGELVFKSRIRKAIKFAEAPVRGSSVLKYDPEGNAANYYRELAKEVLTNGSS
jgi:chromosome partitioning protein